MGAKVGATDAADSPPPPIPEDVGLLSDSVAATDPLPPPPPPPRIPVPARAPRTAAMATRAPANIRTSHTHRGRVTPQTFHISSSLMAVTITSDLRVVSSPSAPVPVPVPTLVPLAVVPPVILVPFPVAPSSSSSTTSSASGTTKSESVMVEFSAAAAPPTDG